MLEAQVKKDARWKVITACSGREFVDYEYRIIPAGFEDEAKANQFLDVRKMKEEAPVEDATPEEIPLEELTVPALRDMAEGEGIDVTGLRKAELVEALKEKATDEEGG